MCCVVIGALYVNASNTFFLCLEGDRNSWAKSERLGTMPPFGHLGQLLVCCCYKVFFDFLNQRNFTEERCVHYKSRDSLKPFLKQIMHHTYTDVIYDVQKEIFSSIESVRNCVLMWHNTLFFLHVTFTFKESICLNHVMKRKLKELMTNSST